MNKRKHYRPESAPETLHDQIKRDKRRARMATAGAVVAWLAVAAGVAWLLFE